MLQHSPVVYIHRIKVVSIFLNFTITKQSPNDGHDIHHGRLFMGLRLELNSLKVVYYSVAPVFAASGARVGSSFFAKVSSGT